MAVFPLNNPILIYYLLILVLCSAPNTMLETYFFSVATLKIGNQSVHGYMVPQCPSHNNEPIKQSFQHCQ